MRSQDQLAEWLKDRLRAASMEPRELASKLGLNRSSVSRWLAGRSRPSPASLRLLAAEFSESVAILYRLAGYPADLGGLSELTSAELELIANYRRLSPEGQSMLKEAARAGTKIHPS